MSCQTTRWISLLSLALLALACASPQEDPLPRMGIPVTEGAAAGYVPDPTCARCHADLYRSYQEVGMARSFYRPRADRMIEDFGGEPFYHPASDRYYRMSREGETVLFERYQLDSQGQPIHRFQAKVDWILGSGHTSRSYLVQNPRGELFVLPIAWYSQSQSWGMSPGFDRPNHLGVERQLKQECMFCHNAYPEVATGSDLYGSADEFPLELPEGIGCQRCHGPGAEHVRAALLNEKAAIGSSIVNPGQLSPQLEADICYGCHFQPSVTLPGVRRFGRGVYSFRPGEPLDDYLTLLDVVDRDKPKEERFEINHHPYRLEQSTCFLESKPGALTCTLCHDPHRKVPPERRKAHYRDACLSCHNVQSCSLDEMADGLDLQAKGLEKVAADDCAACHMSRRRTQDVVQVVMTDHRIQRIPGGPELLAPLEETTPILVNLEMLRPLPEPSSPRLEEIYLASAVMRAGGSQDAARFLAQAVPQEQLTSPAAVLDLVKAELGQRRFQEAEDAADKILEVWPKTAQALDWRAVARLQQGKPEEALADLDAALAVAGERPETLFNRGLVLLSLGRTEEAMASLRRSVDLRPTLPKAWTYLGRALLRTGEVAEAEEAFRQALRIDPSHPSAAVELGRLLDQQGRREEALVILEHGARHGDRTVEVVDLLERMKRSEKKDS
ncbi:MAG: tetratricopeptide repeat protein [Deltaproteobacteria bacterium]|nr:tetratricopeptide repeat protein [Deltaproteobacteria bacterium]